jgi:hypothetical protein
MDIDKLLEECEEYDSEEDILSRGGNKGIQIAEDVFRMCNYDFNQLNGWIFYENYKQIQQTL